ncbi:hypothetical protein QUB80_03920 [Chlorogloeopsis sp. ULAP01]|uniref:hypothetical protein n=1 Tax=Chlorogloeopsis sp. ULAP01 TaxID=3056483 RepID=UPI0025AA390B|nr:hypothetical protein [Chlorogloeopsis sp. ULAP01]MDM9379844.1 hypothetical protein [Chlorogloeopsis sp. ULAP01]
MCGFWSHCGGEPALLVGFPTDSSYNGANLRNGLSSSTGDWRRHVDGRSPASRRVVDKRK